MGRINQCRFYLNKSPQDIEIKTHLQECEEELQIFEESQRNPYWSELYNPDIQLIPNDTTLIVLTDRNVASSGEAFIGFLRLVENVVIVGENSAGGCMFGYITLHQLPHSHLSIKLTTRLYYPLDLQFIEGKGFSPHLWVPASDALNYVVAAIEKGIL